MFYKHFGVLYDFDRKQVGCTTLYFSQAPALEMETLIRAIERDAKFMRSGGQWAFQMKHLAWSGDR